MFKFSNPLRARLAKLDPEIKFHTAANPFGEHGTIVVSHVKKNLRERPVRFVFVGVTTPPKMDLRMLAYIWQSAEEQGYIPHHIQSYGKENEVIDTVRETENIDGKIHSIAAA